MNPIDSTFRNYNGKQIELTIHQVLSTVRNGLAHGSIFTTGRDAITEIVIARERKVVVKDDPTYCKVCKKGGSVFKGHDCLIIEPDSFKQLLRNWFDWLSREKV
ncbi:MAG: hypothetical protein HOH96_07600 [Flavobacteriales bacterium]|nr:hypothetical protein [Flavobacteriales bacterium]